MKAYLFEKLYDWSKKPYQKFFKKNNPWKVSSKELLLYPPDTLGFHTGCFLQKNNFELEPKLEEHDVFHVLTNTGVSVPEEIGMQFYLLGNGKRSLYLAFVIGIGTLFYYAHLKTFYRLYRRGKSAHRFFDLEFEKLLLQPTKNIQKTFNIR